MSSSHLASEYGLLEGFLAGQRVRMANRLIPEPQRRGRAIDIGCGADPVFLLHSEFSVKIGLDKRPSRSFAKSIPEPQLHLIEYDIEKEADLPFRNGSADVVTMLAVLEHMEPARVIPLLIETKRILKPEGVFVMTTPAAWTDWLLRLMAALRLVSPLQIEEHKGTFTCRKLLALLGQVFSEKNVRVGHFEMYMNLWAVAKKESNT